MYCDRLGYRLYSELYCREIVWAFKSGVALESVKVGDSVCRWGVDFSTIIFDETIVKEGDDDERLYEEDDEVFGPEGYKLYKLSEWYDLKAAGRVGKYDIKIDNYVKTDLEFVESVVNITSNGCSSTLFDIKFEVHVHANATKACVLQVVRDVQFEYSRATDTIKWLDHAGHTTNNTSLSMKPPPESFIVDDSYFGDRIKSTYEDGYTIQQEARDMVVGCEPDKYDVVVSLEKVLL